MAKNFKILACVDEAMGLGIGGRLIYRIPSDMANFRSMTMNNVVIMGRKTFESLPGGRPLEGRTNIIITRNEKYSVEEAPNVFIAHSLQDASDLCDAFFYDREAFIIGGGEIYHQAIDEGFCDEARLTVVNGSRDADTFFPVLPDNVWKIYYRSQTQSDFNGKEEINFIYEILKKS